MSETAYLLNYNYMHIIINYMQLKFALSEAENEDGNIININKYNKYK